MVGAPTLSLGSAHGQVPPAGTGKPARAATTAPGAPLFARAETDRPTGARRDAVALPASGRSARHRKPARWTKERRQAVAATVAGLLGGVPALARPAGAGPRPARRVAMPDPPQVLPHMSQLTLADTPNAVGWARLHAVDVLQQWHVRPEIVQNARLIVSELATNAVRHRAQTMEKAAATPALSNVGTFMLALRLIGPYLVIQVGDHDDRPPVLLTVDTEATNGRGVFLVDALSQHWGYYRPEPEQGKVVWAELCLDGPEDSLAVAGGTAPCGV